eukprot:6462485-Amphidinium_carterae.1
MLVRDLRREHQAHIPFARVLAVGLQGRAPRNHDCVREIARTGSRCHRLQRSGSAAVVANKLKLGLRKPRGRHSRVEHRIQAAIGDIEVQWMRSHQTAQQAEAAGLPAAYLTGNAEADLLAGQA